MHVEFPPLFIHPSATEYPASTRSHGLRRTVDLGRVGPPWCRGHMHRRQSRPSYFEKPRRSRGLHLPFKSVHSERCRFPVVSSLVKPSRCIVLTTCGQVCQSATQKCRFLRNYFTTNKNGTFRVGRNWVESPCTRGPVSSQVHARTVRRRCGGAWPASSFNVVIVPNWR